MPEFLQDQVTPPAPEPGPTKQDFDTLMSHVRNLAAGQDQIAQRTSWLPTPQAPAPKPTNVFEDPDRAINERAQAIVAPAQAMAAHANIQLARMNAMQDPRVAIVFKNWANEVDAEMRQWAPIAQLDYNNWIRAAIIVKDSHIDDIRKLQAKERDTFTEGRGGSGGPPAETDNWEPSSAFLEITKKMGEPINMDDFKTRRAKILEYERKRAS